MKVSIIILIYNIEKFLFKCINSAVIQTYKNIEILLVNDGSTDKSLEICNDFSYKDDRIKVVNKRNGGLASARKAGIINATGQFVLFLDGDDYLAPNAVEKLFDAYLKSHADIIIASVNYVYRNKVLPLHYKHDNFLINKFEYINYLIEGKYPWMLASKLFNIEIIRGVEMPYYKVGQDAIVCFQCVLATNNIYIINEHLYNYVQHPASASVTKKKDNIIDTFVFAKDVAMYLDNQKLPIDTKSLLPSFVVRWYISALHKGGYSLLKDNFKELESLFSKNKNMLKSWEKAIFISYRISPFLGNITSKMIHLLRKYFLVIKRKR